MERLTERENDKLIMVKQDNGEYIHAYWDEDNFKAIKKLADYEDLEEQGLLVRLPCKVGDTVYRVDAGAKQPIIPMTVSEIHFLCYKNERVVRFDAIGNELTCIKKARRRDRTRSVSEILLMMFRSANRDYRKAVKQLEDIEITDLPDGV